MRTEVTRSPYCGLPVSRSSKKPSKTRPWLWPATAWCKESRGLRARCQASEGTRGRSVIWPYGLC